MKIQYLTAFVASAVLSVGVASLPTSFSPARADVPASAAKACAGNPCAANPCAANPCAANPCAANPCAANPCAANPCAANPCAANPCAANPCAANPCAGADVVSTITPPHSEVYVESESGLAIRGADPVAYFTQGKAVMGSDRYEYEWNGATWRFASAAHLEAFKNNPEAFAPQYGGYCAKAMSDGNVASVDPRFWTIVDGKLYLNYSQSAQDEWMQDIPGKIALADEFWPGVLNNQPLYENKVNWAQ